MLGGGFCPVQPALMRVWPGLGFPPPCRRGRALVSRSRIGRKSNQIDGTNKPDSPYGYKRCSGNLVPTESKSRVLCKLWSPCMGCIRYRARPLVFFARCLAGRLPVERPAVLPCVAHTGMVSPVGGEVGRSCHQSYHGDRGAALTLVRLE